MSRQRKRREEGESGGQERWLITYADMITLLLVFFIVLYSMSQINNEKFLALVESLQSAFTGTAIVDKTIDSPGNQMSVPQTPVKRLDNIEDNEDKKDEQALDALYVKLNKYIKANHLESQIELEQIPRGVQITFHDKILFDLGSAGLKKEAGPVLKNVGKIISTVDNEVSIEGHTDNNPVGPDSKFASNWDLSGARAQNVMLFLINQDGIAPKRMNFVGYGEYKPRYKNDTKEHQLLNRRVNIVVLRKN